MRAITRPPSLPKRAVPTPQNIAGKLEDIKSISAVRAPDKILSPRKTNEFSSGERALKDKSSRNQRITTKMGASQGKFFKKSLFFARSIILNSQLLQNVNLRFFNLK